jgi:hypothetical protein
MRLTCVVFLFLGLMQLVSAQEAPPPNPTPAQRGCTFTNAYIMWTAGDPCTDQSLATDGQHSGLVPYTVIGPAGPIMVDPVQDTDLAALIKNLPSTPDLIWFFEECFSGGMFDELAPLPNRQYGLASQLYDLPSYYARPIAMGGNNVDGWYSTIYAMRSPNLLVPNVFTKAAINDPFSPSATPYPPRGTEPQGSEQPQIFIQNGGDALRIAPQTDNVAIIWAGAPEATDDLQVAQDILLLRALNYNAAAGQIWVLFGAGVLPNTDPVVAALGGAANANNYLWAATKCTLQVVLGKIFPGPLTGPELLYFMADDHGYNTTQGPNGVPRIGNGGLPVFPIPSGYPESELSGNGIPMGCPMPPM